MDFREVLTRRRSVRTYADRPVPREALERIASAAVVRAPSAGFSQGLRIVAVVTMGYPADGAADEASSSASVFTQRRKARSEVVRWERWE